VEPTSSAASGLRTEELRRDLRDHALSSRGRPERVGAEVELIPIDLDSGRVAPITESGTIGTLALLRSHGESLGWRQTTSALGIPSFEVTGGGTVTFEPGGQVEYASPVAEDVDAVVDHLVEVVEPLAAAGGDVGIGFLTRGFAPVAAASSERLQLSAPRYVRMCAHYDRLGPWGRRMMCHSAAFHVNLDWGDAASDRWRVANAAVPAWTAIFANSRREGGSEGDHRSIRAFQWRHLDPGRCGVVGGADDPAGDYLSFALGAAAFLLGPEDVPSEPMRNWVGRGLVDVDAWRLHLSTLFPEVRPRGYLELRPFDALKSDWYAVPLVLSVGLLYDSEALRTALRILPRPTPEALERAGRLGLGDERLASLARDITTLALEGAARLGARVGGRSLETARAFAEEFTFRGKDPGDEPGDYA